MFKVSVIANVEVTLSMGLHDEIGVEILWNLRLVDPSTVLLLITYQVSSWNPGVLLLKTLLPIRAFQQVAR